MTPKLLFPVWMANLMLVAGLSDSAALLAIGFIVGQGATLLLILYFRKSEQAMLRQWTNALTEAHTSAQALMRAADMRHLEVLKPPSKETA